MRHNLKKSQEITKTEETGIYCYFFTIYLIKLFIKFFSLFTSNQLWLCFSDFCWPSIHGSNTFITKDGSPSYRCKLPWLINFLIGIILQDTKTGIQSTIKKNINILKATRADILRMSINIIQATDIKPVILFPTGGSWVKDSMSNLWGRKNLQVIWLRAVSMRMELYHHH